MEIITEKDFQPQKANVRPRIVKFVNFSKTSFTWTWNKQPYTFLPGEANAKFMERSIAYHFAKHLVNRELIARGRESDTSPRNPKENPYFMELFNRCIHEINDLATGPMDETKAEQEAIDLSMKAGLAKIAGNKSKPIAPASKKKPTATAEKEPTAEEIARMTGGSTHRPNLTSQPATKEEEEFEIIEPEADEEAE